MGKDSQKNRKEEGRLNLSAASERLVIKSSGPLNSCRRCFLSPCQEDTLPKASKKLLKRVTFAPYFIEPRKLRRIGATGNSGALLEIKEAYLSNSKVRVGSSAPKFLPGVINRPCLDMHGTSPLHKAIERVNLDLTFELIDRGVELDCINAAGKTPLHIAIKRGNLDLAFELIDGGVELDCTDAAGKTPLHYAIAINNYNLVVKLLEKGASADNRAIVLLDKDTCVIAPSPFDFARSRLTCLRNSTCSFDWASIFEMIRILRALKEHSRNIMTTQIDDLCDQLQSSLTILPCNSALVPVNVACNTDAEHVPRTNHVLDTVDKICNLFDRLDI